MKDIASEPLVNAPTVPHMATTPHDAWIDSNEPVSLPDPVSLPEPTLAPVSLSPESCDSHRHRCYVEHESCHLTLQFSAT